MIKEKMDIELNNFMYNVAWLRKHHGISKCRMTEILHISVLTLNRLEKGEMPPDLSVEVFFFIRDHFGVSFDDQLTRRLDE